jgi:hypothetical protein
VHIKWLKFTKFFNRQAKVPTVFDINGTDGTIANPVINQKNISLKFTEYKNENFQHFVAFSRLTGYDPLNVKA